MCSDKNYRQMKSRKGRNGKVSKWLGLGFSHEERARLLDVIHPEHKENPFEGKFLRMRNELYIRLLDHLGLTRSQALQLEIWDIDYNAWTIEVRAANDGALDSRNLSTRPLNPELCELIDEYVANHRDQIRKATQHEYLFVSQDGTPLSAHAAKEICLVLRKVQGVPSNLCDHLLRHTWITSISQEPSSASR